MGPLGVWCLLFWGSCLGWMLLVMFNSDCLKRVERELGPAAPDEDMGRAIMRKCKSVVYVGAPLSVVNLVAFVGMLVALVLALTSGGGRGNRY